MMLRGKVTLSELGFPDCRFASVEEAHAYACKRTRDHQLHVEAFSAWRDDEHYGERIRWRRARWYYGAEDQRVGDYAGIIIEYA